MDELSRPSASPQPKPPGNSTNSTSLRHRAPARAATFAEGSPLDIPRRNSTWSDSVPEARNSIRSSTDDLFFPRVAKSTHADVDDESHWQSAPLGLALLPAIAGVFFKNGSAVITDVTLLVLAAIFLNWSVRLPWDWYRSAQELRRDKEYHSTDIAMELEDKDDQVTQDSTSCAENKENKIEHQRLAEAASAASKELHIHEIIALASCFILPIIGTWLLHAIRDKLSRPSEGLVSNYNLTIFLLASEIRPFSHLLKMVQARTLHLQRVVAASYEEERIDSGKISDLTKRLEELEAYIAENAAARFSPGSTQPESSTQDQNQIRSLVSQTGNDVQKKINPSIDALNRAVRRYEKRTALSSHQTESRLRVLEAQVRDTVALAAAAQRTSTQRSGITYLFDWIYAIILIPAQIVMSLTTLPIRVTTRVLQYTKEIILPSSTKGKLPRRSSSSPRRLRKKVSQQLPSDLMRNPIREYND